MLYEVLLAPLRGGLVSAFFYFNFFLFYFYFPSPFSNGLYSPKLRQRGSCNIHGLLHEMETAPVVGTFL